jgi:hypothetical protein
MCQPRNRGYESARSLLLFAALALAVVSTGCKARGASGATELPEGVRLVLGATPVEAQNAGRSSFVLENTPDLALHAELPPAKYDGKTLLIRGTDPGGSVVWNYPHIQNGPSFDAVLPVFGSSAARRHVTGTYSFQVLAPDRSVIAAATASFRSAQGDGGAASNAVNPAVNAMAAARGGH